jgi:NADH-quinone oxidoreductase subunit L
MIGTPVWQWFGSFLNGEPVRLDIRGFAEDGVLKVMLLSTVTVFVGLSLGWWFYGRKRIEDPEAEDSVERLLPQVYKVLRNGFFIDELYNRTIISFNAWFSRASDWLDRCVWGGAVQLVSYLVLGLSWLNRSVDVFVVNRGFDRGCDNLASGGRILSQLQDGRAQRYLRIVGVAFAVFVLFLIMGRHG